MKKTIILIISIILGMLVFCGCEEEIATVTDQTGSLKYQIAEGWTAKSISPAPADSKAYQYNGYTVHIESLSYRFYEDPLTEAVEYAIGAALEADGGTLSYELQPAGEDTVGGMPAKEVYLEGIELGDSSIYSGVFTAIETDTGLYTIATTTNSEELSDSVKKAHRALTATVEYVSETDQEVYADNIFQFSDYICAVPQWDMYVQDLQRWSSRVEYENGVITYVSDADIASISIVPMENVKLTDDIMAETLGYIYNGKIAPAAECVITDRQTMDSDIGSALYTAIDLKVGDDETMTAKASAIFILNEDGQAVACFSNTSNSDQSYDYAGITTSIQAAAPVYGAIDSLYGNATEYIGNNSDVAALLNDLDLAWYGDYTFELQTSEEPYGLTVKYSEEVDNYDFQREAIMLIGLIENLDYVDIRDSNSDIVHYDYELAKSLMKYDVKKMADDKAMLERYYLETLY